MPVNPFARLVERLASPAFTPRTALGIVIGWTLFIVLLGGLLMRLAAPDDFSSYGEAVWWAAQTVTTVGYGDIVPREPLGRAVGTVVMLSGIALITILSGVVASTLVQRARAARPDGEDALRRELEAIRRRLDELAGEGRRPE